MSAVALQRRLDRMRRRAEEAQERNRPAMRPGDPGWALREFGLKATEAFKGVWVSGIRFDR